MSDVTGGLDELDSGRYMACIVFVHIIFGLEFWFRLVSTVFIHLYLESFQ